MTGAQPKPDVETSLWIARPTEDIWEYWYDVSNEPQWRSGVISSQWTSDPPHGVGSTGVHIVQGPSDWPWQVTDWEDLRHISWEITGGRFEGAHVGYRVAPENAGSRVTIHIRVKPSVFTRILMPVVRPWMRGQFAGDLERLKAIMEA